MENEIRILKNFDFFRVEILIYTHPRERRISENRRILRQME